MVGALRFDVVWWFYGFGFAVCFVRLGHARVFRFGVLRLWFAWLVWVVGRWFGRAGSCVCCLPGGFHLVFDWICGFELVVRVDFLV